MKNPVFPWFLWQEKVFKISLFSLISLIGGNPESNQKCSNDDSRTFFFWLAHLESALSLIWDFAVPIWFGKHYGSFMIIKWWQISWFVYRWHHLHAQHVNVKWNVHLFCRQRCCFVRVRLHQATRLRLWSHCEIALKSFALFWSVDLHQAKHLLLRLHQINLSLQK